MDINSLRPRLNRRPFADDILKCIFLNENEWIFPRISLKSVPEVRTYNIPALVQIVAWRRPGDKPLSEPMMVSLLTHICVTRPQWVNYYESDACNLMHYLPRPERYFRLKNEIIKLVALLTSCCVYCRKSNTVLALYFDYILWASIISFTSLFHTKKHNDISCYCNTYVTQTPFIQLGLKVSQIYVDTNVWYVDNVLQIAHVFRTQWNVCAYTYVYI